MYEVIKKFRDKETGKIHNVGDTIKCTEARAKEILSVGNFIKKIESKNKGKKAVASE